MSPVVVRLFSPGFFPKYRFVHIRYKACYGNRWLPDPCKYRGILIQISCPNASHTCQSDLRDMVSIRQDAPNLGISDSRRTSEYQLDVRVMSIG